MIGKNINNKIAVCYIYNKGNKFFWDNIDYSFKNFSEVFIINISDEEFKTTRKNLKIYNVEKENFYTFLGNFFLTKKLNSSHIIFLESNEKLIIDNKIDLKDNDYNIKIKPKYNEVFEYSISPFLTFENRIFFIKKKNIRDKLLNLDLFYKEQLEIAKDIYVEKLEIDSDFELIKTKNINDHNSSREIFMKAVSSFYKDSIKSEDLFKSLIETEYKINSISLIIKLLIIKKDYQKINSFKENYIEYFDSHSYSYLGQMEYDLKNYNKSLRYLTKAVRLFDIEKKENNLNDSLVTNISDVTHKLYKYIGLCFYELKRFSSAEKYLKISLSCINNYFSPEIYLYFAKIRFNEEKYNEAYDIFVQIIKNEETPIKILKELKPSLINLLMFLPFKDEYIDILSKEFIDHRDDILRVADTYYMSNDFIHALELYILSVKRFGYDQKLLFKLGYISSMLKSFNEGIYYFEKFLENDPDNLDTLNNLGFLYLSIEDHEKAENTYLKILSLNAYSFEANLYLALIYTSLKNKIKAEEYIEKARTLNPISNELISLYKIMKKELA